ncbi:ELAV-like protein 1-A [Condylostylus longicornis]|uniref:ELAV-like protein 1-A n=1 Tax=Condylostylus longicornis TaxID=2530218 RepID=UPI00244DB332|nr:ELAV-like protein 1-A [Condylostylus longicornis]
MVRNSMGPGPIYYKKSEVRYSPMVANNPNAMVQTQPMDAGHSSHMVYHQDPNYQGGDPYANNYSNQHPEEYAIFVFNLSLEVVENDLWKMFGPFGAVRNVAVVKDPNTNLCKGYGFVTMRNMQEAELAIDILNGHHLKGRSIKVSFKGPRTRTYEEESVGEPGAYPIYVYNLPLKTCEDNLWKLFGQFGAVKNVSIMQDHVKNMPKGYAFVTMKNLNEAQNAIKAINGFTMDGRVLTVSFKGRRPEEPENANPYKAGQGEAYYADRSSTIPIYVNNLPSDVEEQTIWKLFAQFGAVKDVNLVKDLATMKCKGYGFVMMKDMEEATVAINTLNGFTIGNKIIQVNWKTKKNKQQNQQQSQQPSQNQ